LFVSNVIFRAEFDAAERIILGTRLGETEGARKELLFPLTQCRKSTTLAKENEIFYFGEET
jgi:hypothetical protein